MATTQAVWGIDVGRCALKAVRLRVAAEGKVEIIAHDYLEHAKILSQPDADRQELIANALEKFLSRNDISKDRVVVGVPGQHTLARFTKLPPVAPKRIPDIVRYEADQQIPFDMDEVIWDYQTFEQEGLPDVEVGIFAMKRELLREHLLHFEQAAIEPTIVQCAPLAVFNFAEHEGLLGTETSVLLDIGAENTDLVVATLGSLWTRTIPIGGNRLTDALVASFKLSFTKAESLKRTTETSKYRRQIFQAMRPIFSDLVQELQRSVGFYSSTHRDTQIDKVVGLGNVFRLPGLQKYLQQNLGMPVEIPTTFNNVVPSESAKTGALAEEFLSFPVAFGLAVQGLELTKVTSNLLPTEIAKQVVWRKKRPAFAAAAACLLLAGGLIWFRQVTDIRAVAAGSEEADRIAVSADQAPGIIQNGPSPTYSAWGQAAAVREAGNALREQLNNLAGQGDVEREETETLIELQQNKSLVPKILQVIHESIPLPEGPLGQASTPAVMRELITSGRIPPRAERNLVFIDSLSMQFEPDLNLLELESLVDVEPRVADEEGELPGFGIRITCRTPNEGGVKFIDDTFMAVLRKNGRRPGTGFYFDRVWIISGSKVGAATEGPAGFGGRGSGSFRPGGLTPSGATDDLEPQDRDVVTDEPVLNDWEFEIWVDAVLQDYPESEAEDEGDEEDAEAEDGGE